MKHLYILPFLLAILIISCKKKTEEIIIPNNNAARDSSINSVLIESYINKSYIALLGRKPSSGEQASHKTTLINAAASVTARTAFIQQLQAGAEYKEHLYAIARTQLLNDVDTNGIQGYKESVFQQLQDTSKQAYWFVIQQDYDDLVNLQNIPSQLSNNTLSVQQMYMRCCSNVFYDEINMGTQNFVTSVFDHFMFRYPTQDELQNGKTMVDGSSASVLFTAGKSKRNFLTIVMSSTNYYEGQVRDLIKRYFYRSATTTELSSLTQQYASSKNYQQLQLTLLISNEYVGIK